MISPGGMAFQDAVMFSSDDQHQSPAATQAAVTASVIIVNYNGWSDVERCLRSLEATQMTGFEVIVVDNCSSDGSPEKIQNNFPCVRLFRSGKNLGYGGGNNLGAQAARGSILVFLNPDTVVRPDWLKPLTDTLDADPTTGAVTSLILLLKDADCINTCGNDVNIAGLALCRGMGQPVRSLQGKAERVTAVSGAAFAIRRDGFEAIGGFDEDFFMYMEDTDLSLRLQMAGSHCRCVPASVIFHDYALTFGPLKTFYQERNRYLMLLKTFRWPTLLVLLPALLMSEVITWGFVLLRDRTRFKNKLSAYAWVIAHWRGIMEKRQRTQRLRRVPDRALLRQMTSALDFAQTGRGWVASLANLIFNPLFFVFRAAALALVWW